MCEYCEGDKARPLISANTFEGLRLDVRIERHYGDPFLTVDVFSGNRRVARSAAIDRCPKCGRDLRGGE